MSSTPSCARISLRVLGPSPGILVSSTKGGGYRARSSSSLEIFPVSSNSMILSAVEAPTPEILTNSALVIPDSSPAIAFS